AQRIFGWTEADALGRSLTELMPERFRAAHRAGVDRLLATGVPRVMGRPVELAGLRADGVEFPLELSLSMWHAGADANFTGLIRDMLDDIRAGAERIRRIVRDLRIFSRADEDTRGPVDLLRVLELACNMSWNEIRHRARLVKDYGQPVAVEGNESRLGQVFVN